MFIPRESKKKREARVREIMARLDAHYGDHPMIFLEAKNAWQLLFATILSAQCTDARVNMVTEKLFVKYKDLQAFADCDLKELEEDIHSTGFYHNKAKKYEGLCQSFGRGVWRGSSEKYRGFNCPSRVGRKPEPDIRKHLPYSLYRGGYPCEAHFPTVWGWRILRIPPRWNFSSWSIFRRSFGFVGTPTSLL